jgi:hypothetical protein
MRRKTQHLRNRPNQRRGITSMLAMLYLVLFSSLAIGFYASVNTAVQVANNEQQAAKAMLAAESGLHFIRYHLAAVSIPPRTQPANMMAELYKDLQAHIVGTKNLTGNTIAMVDNKILIPAAPNGYIPLDPAGKSEFKVTILQNGSDVICRINGRYGITNFSNRSMTLDFKRQSYPPSVFDFAIASRGRVVMSKGAITGVNGVSNDNIATIMSIKPTSPAISVTGGYIGGDLHVIADGLAQVNGGTVAGTNSPITIVTNHTHVSEPPDFPEVDTGLFTPYVQGNYKNGNVLKNVRIPANTNPQFSGGATIQGILYIESPNTVSFRGNVDLQGFIIFENKGNSSNNVIDMRGNFSQSPLPTAPEFDPLRSISGIAVLAPTASMVISGSVDSYLKGNVILGKFNNAGSADWTIENGSLLTFDEGDAAVFSGKTVKFKSIGKNAKPSKGLLYSEHYLPVADTYKEIY